jgi:hypothetical protein
MQGTTRAHLCGRHAGKPARRDGREARRAREARKEGRQLVVLRDAGRVVCRRRVSRHDARAHGHARALQRARRHVPAQLPPPRLHAVLRVRPKAVVVLALLHSS